MARRADLKRVSASAMVAAALERPDVPAAPEPPGAGPLRHRPTRNEPCPCGSGRKFKRCCADLPQFTYADEVHEGWEAELAALEREKAEASADGPDVDELDAMERDAGARERPVAQRGRDERWVPADLRARVDREASGFLRIGAMTLHEHALQGRAPAALTDVERDELRTAWGGSFDVDAVLGVLERVGYGQPPPRRARRQRRHGLRRDRRLAGIVGLVARRLALRLPTTAETRRSGRNDGHDIYGQVWCSHTLRPDHLGMVGLMSAFWRRRSPAGDPHAYFTAGEAAHLLCGRGRQGGKDVVWVHGMLADWEAVELRAELKDPSGDRSFAIPSSPVVYVERLVGGMWVRSEDYAAAAAALNDEQRAADVAADEAVPVAGDVIPTIRVRLADWVLEDLRERRPVFVDFDVWAHLRPSARRLYAFLQGRPIIRDDAGKLCVRFYLAEPLRYTLGVGRCRHRRAVAIVRGALAALRDADRRYAIGWGEGWRTNTDERVRQFTVHLALKPPPSTPTRDALATKSAPRRPTALRGTLVRRRVRVLRAHELDDGTLREMSVEDSRAIQAGVAESIARSRQQAERALDDDPRRRQRIQERDRRSGPAGPAPPGS